jgi:chemotaxis protein CheX
MKSVQHLHHVVSKVGADVLLGYLGLNDHAHAQRELSFQVVNKEVSVIIQMVGQLGGQVILSMEKATAREIVSSMMGGAVVQELDDLAWSAIQEFANWFVSAMAIEFSDQGYDFDIAHPIVNEGRSILHSDQTYILVPLESSCGKFEIYSSIKWREAG